MTNSDGQTGLDYTAARRIHFDRRVIQRYGHRMLPGVKSEIARMIREAHDDVELINDSEFPNMEFRVLFGLVTYRIIFNMVDTTFVTALPLVDGLPPPQAKQRPPKKSKKTGKVSYYVREKLERLIEQENDNGEY